jgi:hypothetical protein
MTPAPQITNGYYQQTGVTGMLMAPQPAAEVAPVPLQIPEVSKTHVPTAQEFVAQVCNLFMQHGYQVSNANSDVPGTLLLTKGGKKAIATYLWQEGMVGPDAVQPFLQLMTAWEASHGYFVTTGAFTLQVEDLVAGKPVQLIDGREFAALLEIEESRRQDPTSNGHGHDVDLDAMPTASLQGPTRAISVDSPDADATPAPEATPTSVSQPATTTTLDSASPAEEPTQE